MLPMGALLVIVCASVQASLQQLRIRPPFYHSSEVILSSEPSRVKSQLTFAREPPLCACMRNVAARFAMYRCTANLRLPSEPCCCCRDKLTNLPDPASRKRVVSLIAPYRRSTPRKALPSKTLMRYVRTVRLYVVSNGACSSYPWCALRLLSRSACHLYHTLGDKFSHAINLCLFPRTVFISLALNGFR